MNFLESLLGAGLPQLSPTEAQERLSVQPRPYLLDVREAEEYQQAHINGATLIPLGKLRGSLSKLPKDREILVICASGSRSSSATRLLLDEGYKAVNVRGGMGGWARAGLPYSRGK